MNKLRQKGFSAIEALLIVFLVGLIGFVGWYVWNINRDTNANNISTSTASTASSTEVSKADSVSPDPAIATSSSAGYLVIKEWGVKIKLADAEKISYEMNGEPNGSSANADGVVSYAALSLKDTVTTSANCKSLTTSISQHLASSNIGEGANMTTVGKYAYGIDGALNSCDDMAINSLQEKIFSDLIKRSIVAE